MKAFRAILTNTAKMLGLVLETMFGNWMLSGQYTKCLNKFLFIWTNCPDKREPVNIQLAMVAEALSSIHVVAKKNGGEVGV